MKNLTILDTQIRTLDNLYSLNDLHRASGGENKHQPFRFIRNEQTQSLISELQQDIQRSNSISGKSQTPNLVCRLVRGGCDTTIRGYWVCQELVIAYAAWISAAFHLKVIRAFMAINGIGTQPQQLALPEPTNKIVLNLDDFYMLAKAMNYLNHSVAAWERLEDLFSDLESHKNYKTAFNLGTASNRLAQALESFITKHTPFLKNANIREEIENWIFNSPRTEQSPTKTVNYLR